MSKVRIKAMIAILAFVPTACSPIYEGLNLDQLFKLPTGALSADVVSATVGVQAPAAPRSIAPASVASTSPLRAAQAEGGDDQQPGPGAPSQGQAAAQGQAVAASQGPGPAPGSGPVSSGPGSAPSRPALAPVMP